MIMQMTQRSRQLGRFIGAFAILLTVAGEYRRRPMKRPSRISTAASRYAS